jgi:hypothetical protein
MKNHILKLSTIIPAFLLLMTSCKKDTVNPEGDTLLVASQTSAETARMVDIAEDEAVSHIYPAIPAGTCPAITFSEPRDIYPNTVTIDFGEGCTGRFGHRFSGQIKVEMTAPYFVEGSVRTISSGNLIIDGTHLTFSRVVSNGGMDAENRMFWKVNIDVHRMQGNHGNVTTYNAIRTRTMIKGFETQDDMSDDAYEIMGTASGTLPNKREFSSVIAIPLMKHGDCRWIVSGVEVTNVERRAGEYKLDFGDGTCDDKATLTRPNGSTTVVTLGGKWL